MMEEWNHTCGLYRNERAPGGAEIGGPSNSSPFFIGLLDASCNLGTPGEVMCMSPAPR